MSYNILYLIVLLVGLILIQIIGLAVPVRCYNLYWGDFALMTDVVLSRDLADMFYFDHPASGENAVGIERKKGRGNLRLMQNFSINNSGL